MKKTLIILLAFVFMASMVEADLRVLQHLPDDMYLGTTSELVNFNCSVQGQDLRNVSMQLDGVWKKQYDTLPAGVMNWTNWTVALSSSSAVQWWSCKSCNATECVDTVNKSVFILPAQCASNCTIASAIVGNNVNVTYNGNVSCLTWCRIANTSGWCNPQIDLLQKNMTGYDYSLELLQSGRLNGTFCAAYWLHQSNTTFSNSVVVLSNSSITYYVLVVGGLAAFTIATIVYLLRRRRGS